MSDLKEPFTDAKVRAYSEDTDQCPYCGSGNYEGDDYSLGWAGYQELSCSDCDGEWTDMYDITRIRDGEGKVYDLPRAIPADVRALLDAVAANNSEPDALAADADALLRKYGVL